MLSLKGKRVFIVEDNAANRAIIMMLLERCGAQASFERYGTHTVSKLRAFAPVDIILLDLMLPDGVSGFKVADDIQQEEAFRNVPIVVVSAADPAEAMPKAQARGFAGFISKPIDVSRFPNQIARLMSGEHLWLDHD